MFARGRKKSPSLKKKYDTKELRKKSSQNTERTAQRSFINKGEKRRRADRTPAADRKKEEKSWCRTLEKRR